jgi:hypothetical protein
MANKGKAMQKSEILKVAKATLESMFIQSGREGMLGIARTWEAQQAKETKDLLYSPRSEHVISSFDSGSFSDPF